MCMWLFVLGPHPHLPATECLSTFIWMTADRWWPALGLALFPTLSVHPSSVFFSLGSSNAHAGCSKQALLPHLSLGWSLRADRNLCGPASLLITVQRVCVCSCCMAGALSLQGGFGLAWVGFSGQECEGISSSQGQRLGYASLPPPSCFLSKTLLRKPLQTITFRAEKGPHHSWNLGKPLPSPHKATLFLRLALISESPSHSMFLVGCQITHTGNCLLLELDQPLLLLYL